MGTYVARTDEHKFECMSRIIQRNIHHFTGTTITTFDDENTSHDRL